MGLLVAGNNPAALRTANRAYFTATAGQTTFTVPNGYPVGDIDVYINGIRVLDSEDYVATNGTTVVLNTGANLGDSISVISYNQFSVSNTYSKTESDSRYLNLSGGSLSGYIKTPNYGITTGNDTTFASLEANSNIGTQGTSIRAYGKDVATTGGDILYTADSRGAGGRHRFGYWNGTSFTNSMTLDSSGRMTLPNQPYWAAEQTRTDSGPFANRKMVWWTNYYNIGGHWDSANSKFTCPVSGWYQVVMQGIKYPQNGASHVDLYKNGGTFGIARARAEETGTYAQFSTTNIVQCSAGDYLEFYQFGDAGLHGSHGLYSIRLVG